jgi:hypothetical protein
MQNLRPLTYPNLKADKTKENASCSVLQTYEYKLKSLYAKSATLLNNFRHPSFKDM